MASKKIAVLGSGANGASIGADLTAAGHDVRLIDQWPENVDAMRSGGLRVEMPNDTLHVKVRAYHLCDVATFTEQFDVVLVVVKAYDTAWACQLIEPYVKPDGLVAGVQNGMTTDRVARVMGPGRTVGTVIEISSAMERPGVVQRDSPPDRSWFAVGTIDQTAAGRETEIAELLAASGAVEVVDDIQSAKWMKLVSNCTTLVTSAILGLPLQAALEIAGMRELMVRSGQEALEAGGLRGLAPLPIYGLTAADLGRAEQTVDVLLDVIRDRFVLAKTKTTTLQDWSKGRHSEVDDINGLVVAEFAAAGRRAPVNAAVVEVAHRIERRELTPAVENLSLLEDLARCEFPATARFAYGTSSVLGGAY